VTGLGSALLLERVLFRIFPRTRSFSWRFELAMTGGYFLPGSIGFYLMRPGIVPVWEALYRGIIVLLVGGSAETLVELLGRQPGVPAKGSHWPGWRNVALRLGLLCMLGLLVPVLGGLHPLHTVPKRTPAAQGLAFEEAAFTTADGLKLRGWLVSHPQARGNVIFCHGHGRNRGHAAALLPLFHALRLNALAFDFRGHGESAGHTSTFGHREVLDLVAAATYLCQRYPDQPLFLVGVSLGAAVSLQTLPQLPEVRGVWSEGSFCRLSHVVEHQGWWLPRCLRKPLAAFYAQLGWLDCGVQARQINLAKILQNVRVPVYFVHGQEDELVPLTEGEALYAAYHGPKHWWAVPGASHYRVRQDFHEEYPRRLRAFLEECLGISGSEVAASGLR
jgi:pimeloyl-ACP methyl ester carboxylesterase